MTVNPLPPQAYTKETLQKAYSWLLTQNASVKDLATSQDMLVSMYLKAQRSGDASLETPSIQNFKQELKSLATMMGDLQTPVQTPQTSVTYTTTLPTYSQQPVQPTPTISPSRPVPQTFVQSSTQLSFLDDQSLGAIQEVKAALNLSSDIEALRALVSLGYKQFKKSNI